MVSERSSLLHYTYTACFVLLMLNAELESEPVQLTTCVRLITLFSKRALGSITLPLNCKQPEIVATSLLKRQSTTTNLDNDHLDTHLLYFTMRLL